MNFVTVNYHLNQTYKVEDKALEQIVKDSVKGVKSVKLQNVHISISKDNTGFKVKMLVEIKKSASIRKAALEIEEKIEYYSLNLTASKPENIQIIFKEVE